ncbi:MAG: hypothetical protein KFH87_12195 [Bacteroidetes bacterium]|nr:hypothetical protein [Bacteroidota bacterium]
MDNGFEIPGPTEVGTRKARPEEIELSQLIDILNDRFGTEFKPADQLFFDSIKEDAVADDSLRQAALANTEEHFGFVFRRALEGLIVARLNQNEEIAGRCLNEPDVQKVVGGWILREVYEEIRSKSKQEKVEEKKY